MATKHIAYLLGPPVNSAKKMMVLNGPSGEVLDVFPMDTRICNESPTIGDLFPIVEKAIRWPATHIQLVVGEQTFEHFVLTSNQSSVKLWDLLQPNEETLLITPIKLRAPSDYSLWSGMCRCDFGHCCRLGCGKCSNTVGLGPMCDGCGNGSCCRCAKCGHQCCEALGSDVEPESRIKDDASPPPGPAQCHRRR